MVENIILPKEKTVSIQSLEKILWVKKGSKEKGNSQRQGMSTNQGHTRWERV